MKQSLQKQLESFYGSEHWYQQAPFKIVFTDGVKYFAEKGKANWAVTDIMATAEALNRDFLVVTIEVADEKATITYGTDSGDEFIVARQEYEFTDLEAGIYKFYVMDDGIRKTMLLPSEY